MALESAFVEYPLGYGQRVTVPRQVYPVSFTQYVNMTNPYRLTLAGIGYLDLPSGLDLWTPNGYVPVEDMLGEVLEFAPQFNTWQKIGASYVSTPVVAAHIRRSKVLAVAVQTGTQLSALPLYEGTFIQLEPTSRAHIALTVNLVPEQDGTGIPLGLTCVAEIPVVAPDDNLPIPNEFAPIFESTSGVVYTNEMLIVELGLALTLGSSTILYDGQGDPIQVSGTYLGNLYVVTYVYGTFGGLKKVSYTTATYKGASFTNIYGYDGDGDLVSSTGWIRP